MTARHAPQVETLFDFSVPDVSTPLYKGGPLEPLVSDYDGTARNADAHAQVLGETGQVSDYQAAEIGTGVPSGETVEPIEKTDAAVVVRGVEGARQYLAGLGVHPTRVDRRPLARGKRTFDLPSGGDKQARGR